MSSISIIMIQNFLKNTCETSKPNILLCMIRRHRYLCLNSNNCPFKYAKTKINQKAYLRLTGIVTVLNTKW